MQHTELKSLQMTPRSPVRLGPQDTVGYVGGDLPAIILHHKGRRYRLALGQVLPTNGHEVAVENVGLRTAEIQLVTGAPVNMTASPSAMDPASFQNLNCSYHYSMVKNGPPEDKHINIVKPMPRAMRFHMATDMSKGDVIVHLWRNVTGDEVQAEWDRLSADREANLLTPLPGPDNRFNHTRRGASTDIETLHTDDFTQAEWSDIKWAFDATPYVFLRDNGSMLIWPGTAIAIISEGSAEEIQYNATLTEVFIPDDDGYSVV